MWKAAFARREDAKEGEGVDRQEDAHGIVCRHCGGGEDGVGARGEELRGENSTGEDGEGRAEEGNGAGECDTEVAVDKRGDCACDGPFCWIVV